MITATAPTYSQFLLKRLHSLTGLIPLTFFVVFHFFANSYSRHGAAEFDAVVMRLRGLPFLLTIEWGLLFAPFLFHMIYGLWLVFTARHNPVRQAYARNWAYVLQRVTAVILFVFIIQHVVVIRFNIANHKPNVYEILREHFSHPIIYWWYVFGIACTAFHLANGVCTFCMTWGITVGRRSQRAVAGAMAGVGVLVFALGFAALDGFVSAPKPHPQEGGQVPVLAQAAPPTTPAP